MSLVETTQGEMQKNWRGPLIVYAKPNVDCISCQDVTLGNFRAFLDHCKKNKHGGLGTDLKMNMFIELELTNPTLWNSLLLKHSVKERPTFKGVEIACTGDQEFMNLDKFRTVDVSVVHPVFDTVNKLCHPTDIRSCLACHLCFGVLSLICNGGIGCHSEPRRILRLNFWTSTLT
jgi:hypothetical protein